MHFRQNATNQQVEMALQQLQISTGSNASGSTIVPPGARKKVMLVYMVGGLTYLEVAALRQLSRHPLFPYTILIATTKLVSPNTLLASMIDGDIRF